MRNITLSHTGFHIATVTPNWEPYDEKENKFPPAIHHVPIGVSVLDLKSKKGAVQAVTRTKVVKNLESERSLVRGALQQLPGKQENLLSFGGISFCGPVLLYRAMHYGIPQVHDRLLTHDRGHHVDLKEVLGNYGALYAASLSDFAQLIRLPKRPYLKVDDAFNDGALDAIRGRLEIDVMIIGLLWLSGMHAYGTISSEELREAGGAILEAYSSASPGVRDYLEKANLLREDDD